MHPVKVYLSLGQLESGLAKTDEVRHKGRLYACMYECSTYMPAGSGNMNRETFCFLGTGRNEDQNTRGL